MKLDAKRKDWPLKTPLRISYQSHSVIETVVVTLRDGEYWGRGEGLGVSYKGESADSLLKQIRGLGPADLEGLDRTRLSQLLVPGGARNAIDCALWDLEAKRSAKSVFALAGIETRGALRTAFTLSIDTPEAMGQAARAAAGRSVLKLKLDKEQVVERVAAVREARPDADIIVDANQAWNGEEISKFVPAMQELGVKLIEQPLPVGQDDFLLEFDSPLPLCADESCQTSDSVAELTGKYKFVNIKLDKTGGLTEALELAEKAKAAGLRLMVGCMAGSSISMAPAFVIGQLCEFVDLDGPLLAVSDIAHGIRYDGSTMHPPSRELWG